MFAQNLSSYRLFGHLKSFAVGSVSKKSFGNYNECKDIVGVLGVE